MSSITAERRAHLLEAAAKGLVARAAARGLVARSEGVFVYTRPSSSTAPPSLAERQQALLQRLFGAEWERAAARIAVIQAAKARPFGGVR